MSCIYIETMYFKCSLFIIYTNNSNTCFLYIQVFRMFIVTYIYKYFKCSLFLIYTSISNALVFIYTKI